MRYYHSNVSESCVFLHFHFHANYLVWGWVTGSYPRELGAQEAGTKWNAIYRRRTHTGQFGNTNQPLKCMGNWSTQRKPQEARFENMRTHVTHIQTRGYEIWTPNTFFLIKKNRKNRKRKKDGDVFLTQFCSLYTYTQTDTHTHTLETYVNIQTLSFWILQWYVPFKGNIRWASMSTLGRYSKLAPVIWNELVQENIR